MNNHSTQQHATTAAQPLSPLICPVCLDLVFRKIQFSVIINHYDILSFLNFSENDSYVLHELPLGLFLRQMHHVTLAILLDDLNMHPLGYRVLEGLHHL